MRERGTGIRLARAVGLGAVAVLLAACGSSGSSGNGSASGEEIPTIVVTTPLLGALVSDLAGDLADVRVLMQAGVDPHDWQPSAKDVELLNGADLVVVNGLHLEEPLDDALAEAEGAGIPVFEAGEHVETRTIGAGEPTGHEEADGEAGHEEEEHGVGADDPHIWTDPIAMRAVATALAPVIEQETGIDLGGRPADLAERLDELDRELAATLAAVPDDRRKLVTGHESMGYFADRYGFELEGTVIPGLTSQAAVSASELAALKEQIEDAGVSVVFTEIGTPTQVAEALADETGATLVELPSHNLPEDGSYFTFMRGIAATIAQALAP